MTLTLALTVSAIFIVIFFNMKRRVMPVMENPNTVPIETGDRKNQCKDIMEWTDGSEIAIYRAGGLINRRYFLKILSHTNVGSRSIASVIGPSPMSSRKKYTYYGVYPASAFTTSRRKAIISGYIPKIQKLEQDSVNPRLYKADMTLHGYMYAISSCKTRNGRENELLFQPLVNILVFKFYSLADNYKKHKLVSIRLSSEQNDASLTGRFKTRLDPETGEHIPIQSGDITGGSNTIIVYFGRGIALGKGPEEETVINLIAIPMDHSKLSLSLRFDNGSILDLKLAGKGEDWVTAKACKKTVFYNIAIPEEKMKKPRRLEATVSEIRKNSIAL